MSDSPYVERGVETSYETGKPFVRCLLCRSPWAHDEARIQHNDGCALLKPAAPKRRK